jgi:hypothetical protein
MYDYDFMDYTIRVLRKCKEYGFRIYMDPHQDIVSVYSSTHKSFFISPRKRPPFRPVSPRSALPSRDAPLGLLTSDPSPLTTLRFQNNGVLTF